MLTLSWWKLNFIVFVSQILPTEKNKWVTGNSEIILPIVKIQRLKSCINNKNNFPVKHHVTQSSSITYQIGQWMAEEIYSRRRSNRIRTDLKAVACLQYQSVESAREQENCAIWTRKWIRKSWTSAIIASFLRRSRFQWAVTITLFLLLIQWKLEAC